MVDEPLTEPNSNPEDPLDLHDSHDPRGEAKRLHPLTLVQRVIVSLPAIVFILLPVFRGGDSMAWFNLVLAGMYVVIFVPWIGLQYLKFRYWITAQELVIHSGVLTRRKRNIPVDRIQNIVIEQAPLQRILGTAKVVVYTAGSATAEGMLEYVSLAEAQYIRSVVRQLQAAMKDVSVMEKPPGEVDESTKESLSQLLESAPDSGLVETHPEPNILYQLSPRRTVLAGVFRFSLLYIAAFFSLLQYIEPDPERMFFWLLRGPLEPWQDVITGSPWLAGALAAFGAISLGWFSGILLTINRYHHFRIERIGDKLHRSHGLMTLKEGTIPLRRIQAYIVRTHPLMAHFGWFRLELQTMGMDLNESGFEVAIPIGRREDVTHFLNKVGAPSVPTTWAPVSKLTIRRFLTRSFVALTILIGIPAFWRIEFLWGLLIIPLLIVMAFTRYRYLGYAESSESFAVRRGWFRRHEWIIPIRKLQTASVRSSWFQRRLGLATVYVDTAGASPVQSADLIDVPFKLGEDLVRRVYDRFSSAASASADAPSSEE